MSIVVQPRRYPQVRDTRVLCIIPGEEHHPSSMSFVKRQLVLLRDHEGLEIEPFYLRSRVSPSPRNLLEIYKRLRHVIRIFSPHVVHAQYGTMTSALAAITSCCPIVITYRGSDLNPSPANHCLRSYTGLVLSQLSAFRASHIVCVSRQLQRRLWRNSVAVSILPSGVDLELFSPQPQSIARRALGWIDDTPVVLFNAGRNPIGKRLDLAEAAVNFAKQEIPELRLHVLRGGVPANEMPYYFNAADCVLITSDYEGSPNMVKEALACNVPVVSVEVGDVAERLAGVEPSVVTARDPKLLGTALRQIVRSRQRSNGRDAVLALDHHAIAKQLATIYIQVARK